MPAVSDEGIEIPKEDVRKRTVPVPRPPLPKLPMPRAVPKSEQIEPALFIKVEKYQSVVESLDRLKSHAQDMRRKLDTLESAQRQLQSAIDAVEQTLNSFNSAIASLDGLLYRRGVGRAELPRSELEGYAKDFYSQIEKIRNELRKI